MPDSSDFLDEDLILTKTFSVRSHETDMAGKLRPGALLNCLIQAAIDSADKLGFGLADLQADEVFWALSRITLFMDRSVEWREEIHVQTWPKDISGLHALRDFRILDNNKNEIGKALSGWLLVDQHSKRPRKVERNGLFTQLRDRHAADPESLERLIEPKEAHHDEVQVESTYYDFDINQHVTAARYVDWMMDTLPFDFQQRSYVSKMSINFVREILPGDGVLIRTWEAPDFHYFSGASVEEGRLSFQGKFTFKQ
jgi:acyl-ACP thioesterase